ncbi:hypothetical protein ACFSKM_06345 [Ancylobacter dichloromethanicus]
MPRQNPIEPKPFILRPDGDIDARRAGYRQDIIQILVQFVGCRHDFS